VVADAGELRQREREEVDLDQRRRVAEEFGERGCGGAGGRGRGDPCGRACDPDGQRTDRAGYGDFKR
jgi:hypothetical protein